MNITPDLADRLYTVLVEAIDAPDDYRRWSFIYAITEGHVSNYLIDSKLGFGARFRNEESPIVVCLDDAPDLQRIALRVNGLILEVAKKEPKVIRPIRIRATETRVKIPVVQVPSLATTIQQLSV